jgi:hypothetical protein
MACIRHDSMVEVVNSDGISLRAATDLRIGDVLNDPLVIGRTNVVEKVIVESAPRVDLYFLFGLHCAGPQLVLYNGMWARVEQLSAIHPGSRAQCRDVSMVGLVLRGSCTIRVDGVICRGLRKLEWEAAHLDYVAVTLSLKGSSFRKSFKDGS